MTTTDPTSTGHTMKSLIPPGQAKLHPGEGSLVKTPDSKNIHLLKAWYGDYIRNSSDSKLNRQTTQYFFKGERFEQIFYKGNRN